MTQLKLCNASLESTLEASVQEAFAEFVPDLPYVHEPNSDNKFSVDSELTVICLVAIDGPLAGLVASIMDETSYNNIGKQIVHDTLGEESLDALPPTELQELIEGSHLEIANRLASNVVSNVPIDGDFTISFPAVITGRQVKFSRNYELQTSRKISIATSRMDAFVALSHITPQLDDCLPEQAAAIEKTRRLRD